VEDNDTWEFAIVTIEDVVMNYYQFNCRSTPDVLISTFAKLSNLCVTHKGIEFSPCGTSNEITQFWKTNFFQKRGGHQQTMRLLIHLLWIVWDYSFKMNIHSFDGTLLMERLYAPIEMHQAFKKFCRLSPEVIPRLVPTHYITKGIIPLGMEKTEWFQELVKLGVIQELILKCACKHIKSNNGNVSITAVISSEYQETSNGPYGLYNCHYPRYHGSERTYDITSITGQLRRKPDTYVSGIPISLYQDQLYKEGSIRVTANFDFAVTF
jgi:hypothetical protein